MSVNETRAAVRDRQREIAEELKASGALDGIFAQIDAGAALTGSDSLLSGMLKAVLEGGLEVEMSDHLGYDRGDPDAAACPDSRNGTSVKTVSTEVGEVILDVPPRPGRHVRPDAGSQGAASSGRVGCGDHQSVRRGDDGA